MPEPLSIAEPQLDLQVGALVVYGGYGLGRVSARRERERDACPAGSVVVEFADGLSVTLPLDRAAACLRAIADADVVARVQTALRDEESTFEPSWQARTRSTRNKIAAGEPVGLAEVVRDAVTRQRRSTRGALSMYERELYLKARHLLAAELGAATATDPTQADAWIDGQLGTSADGPV